MASKITINLDTSKENYLAAKCKQNDDLVLEANIYEDGLALDLRNKVITIQALKADKTYIIQNTSITKENNKIIAELEKDFTRVPGKTLIEVVLAESSKQNTTFSFYVEVVGSVIKGAVESSNTVTILEALENKIVEAGAVKEETEQLIQNGGAATKGDIQQVNSQLDLNMNYTNEIRDNRNIFYTKNVGFIAHRGTSLYPENTILAINKCYEMGYKWIEIDVAITSDKKFVLCHDEVGDRIFANAKTGTLKTLTYDEIKNYDIKVGDVSDYPNEKIATFEECLKTCKKLNIGIFIHIEYLDVSDIQPLVNLIKSNGMSDKCTINSYKMNLIQEVRKYDLEIPVTVFGGYAQDSIDNIKKLKNSFMNVSYEHADSKTKVDAYHNAGMKVVVYTINDYAKSKLLINNGVDYIVTDTLLGGN